MNEMTVMEEITGILPKRIRTAFSYIVNVQGVSEIRLRTNCPVYFLLNGQEKMLGEKGQAARREEEAVRVREGEIRECLDYISRFSLYAYGEEMKNGFLTIPGGHRIGLCGSAVAKDSEIQIVKHISSLNIRIAHSVPGCGHSLLPYLIEKDNLCSTLLFSPPGAGKTTFLRDLIRLLSDGEGCRGRNVGVVDSRSELAACYQGIPQHKIGQRTDVLDGSPRGAGVELLLRTMAPEVIAVDEIGNERDKDALLSCMNCGCSLLATAHGGSREELLNRPFFKELSRYRVFKRYVLIERKENIRRTVIWDETGHLLKEG